MNKYNMKQCGKCKEILPTTSHFFSKCKRNKTGFQSYCKQCTKSYSEKWHKRTWEVRKEKENEKSRQYYIDNPSYRKEYYEKNKSWLNENSRMNYRKDKKKHKMYCDNWRKNNKVKFDLIVRKYQHKKYSVPFDFTERDWENALDYFNHKCAYCDTSENLQKEHVIPVSKNGSFTPDNIIPACPSCNVSKLARDLYDWYPNYKHYSKERLTRIENFVGKKEMEQLQFNI